MRLRSAICLLPLLALASCGPAEVKGSRSAAPSPDSLQRNFRTWYAYATSRTPLGSDFRPLSAEGVPMARKAFLEALGTGRFIALRTGDAPEYRLHPLTSPDKDIRMVVTSLARTQLAHDARIGKPLPPFSFTDLEGRSYTTASTKGRYLVVKCWFIGCTACVAEFPELNKLVEECRGRTDVQFLSLTLDKKPALEGFLKSLPFRYAVVAEAESYVTGPLGVDAYPHHLLVSPEGLVLQSTNSLKDLLPVLRAHLQSKG
ncbi:TlpA disulfide reductase family protein [Flaviaesturariibacter amylovorans]|uniref:Thioredoxin domain-containing protein n=1 Tax=Flaviaesturariibacter amylovorans TaxID=1084520 RepID=A0ABP8HBN3_9BACT